MRRLLSTLLLTLLVASCSGGETITKSEDSGPLDDAVDSVGPVDSVEPPDLAEPDLAEPDFGEPDFGEPDLAEPDTVGPTCAPGEGCFLDPCTENGDCQSGWCVDHMGESVCSQLCQEECPQGWSCQQVGGGGPDVVWVCISDYANLCKPCATTEGCKAIGGAEDVCVDYGPDGNFCGGTCTADTDCPWGFLCSDVVTVDGVGSRQCVAEAGICPCTSKSIALALTTPCEVTNEFGTCVGQRVCAEEGLSDCDAPEPAAETCDGVDNDCDGFTDEPNDVGGDLVNLCDDENECTTDTCDGETGCSHVALTEGECKDGDACTVGDHCEAGVCIGNPVVCDDQNPCTDDSCDGTGGCLFEPNNADCDDGDPCTVADECNEGLCGGTAIACDCQVDADCAALEDDDLCNGSLVCDTSGLPYQCVVDPATVITCAEPAPGPDAICQKAACDPQTGACSLVPDHEGFACSMGDPCTVGDQCVAGVCESGVAVSCNDGNPCTDDACDDEQGCVHTPNNGACDDGNACTVGDHCAEGECIYDDLLVCDDDNVCTTDSCTPDGGCSFKLNSAPCDDDDVCTIGDHCHLGECISAGQLSCNDNNPCTADSCNPNSGCAHSPAAGDCDDGNPCTEGDYCNNGSCTFAAFVTCDDGLVCNGQEVCDPTTGCVDGPDPLLDDGIGCTFDYCDEAEGGVVHAPVDETCDDKLWCNGLESCDAQLGCLPGIPVVLDDGLDCTVDLCDEATDTVKHLPDDTACEDGDACNGTGTCDALLGCVYSDPIDCDDGLVCTADGCDPNSGCTHTPDDGLCDDGESCTTDSCDVNNGCLHTPIQDGTQCTSNGLPGECVAGICTPDCQPGTQTFTYTGSEVTFQMPACATTTIIETWGAEGGDESSAIAGKGAYMKCRFNNLANKTLVLHVGGEGKKGTCDICGGGGGGGAFVWDQGNAGTPLVIGGGGGGASLYGDNGYPGLTTQQGGAGGYSVAPVTMGGYTDNGGGGGTGAGGGGWVGTGQSNQWASGGQAKGGAGGLSIGGYTGDGGWGGGGGSYHGGGGGGGYTGGSGGTYYAGGGGGGSICNGDLLDSQAGARTGNGQIVISWE